MARPIGLRAFPRPKYGVRQEGADSADAARQVGGTSIDNVILTLETGAFAHGSDALCKYISVLALAHPDLFLSLFLIALDLELLAEYKRSGLPIPGDMRNRFCTTR